MLGSQLVTLLGDVIEPLEGGTLMEKRVFELPVCGWNVIHCSMLGRLASHSCIHAFLPQWTVSPQTANPDKPSLPKVAFLGIFRHSNSKVTSTRVFISLWTQEWNFRVIKKKKKTQLFEEQPDRFLHSCTVPHPTHILGDVGSSLLTVYLFMAILGTWSGILLWFCDFPSLNYSSSNRIMLC